MTSILKVDTIQTAAGGTPTAADLGLNVSGSVLQVQSTSFTDYRYLTSSSWNTVQTVTITPASTTSKILVVLNLNGCSTNGNTRLAVRLLRDGTQDFIVESYAGGGPSGDTGGFGSCSATWLDSPAKDTSVSYAVQAHATANTAYATVNDYVTASGRTASSLTLIEIAG